MMRAAVWYGRKNTKVVDVPEAPDPGPGEVKIKVAWTGICGTDLHEYWAGPIWMPLEPHPLTGKAAPLIQGHEYSLCEICAYLGLGRDGVFAPYVTIPADSVFHVPANISLQQASFSEPTAVAVHVLQRGRLAAGDSVLILGAGNQGLLQY